MNKSHVIPLIYPVECILSLDATKITLAPSNADINTGDSSRMECAASHDPTLDLTFIWSLDDHVIDFDRDREHYDHKMVMTNI